MLVMVAANQWYCQLGAISQGKIHRPTKHSTEKQDKTTPCGFNPMKSQVSYRAAQGLRGIKVVLARPKHGTDKSCMLLQCMRRKSPLRWACFECYELTNKHISAVWRVGAAASTTATVAVAVLMLLLLALALNSILDGMQKPSKNALNSIAHVLQNLKKMHWTAFQMSSKTSKNCIEQHCECHAKPPTNAWPDHDSRDFYTLEFIELYV